MALTTKAEALSILRGLEDELRGRTSDNDKYQKYYDGKHSLKFASKEFREWFETQFNGFADNWCAPVADATTERLGIVGIRPLGADRVDTDLQRIWESNSAPADSKLAFTTSAVTGRSFALVWGDEDGPTITFEHPSQCVVGYEPGSRRKRKAALKLWRDGSEDFATLYLPDTVWKFKRRNVGASDLHIPASYGSWSERRPKEDASWPLINPMGVVPIVELQNRPKLTGPPLNEISGVAAMQDAINALWSYLFTAADFAALPQRVILGAQLPTIPILNEDGKRIGEKPIELPEANIKRILNFDGPDAKIDSWDAANLEIFTGVIERAVSHVANQTRTPLHYFASSVQNISGDTLKALETGLVAKIADRKQFYNDPMRELFALVALAAGDAGKAEAVRAGTVMWSDHEARSDAQAMDKLVKLQTLGFPWEYIAEVYTGGDADEVARIKAMREDEAKNDPLSVLNKTLQGAEDQAAGQGSEQAAEDARKRGATGGSDNGEHSGTRAARAS